VENFTVVKQTQNAFMPALKVETFS